MDKELYIVNFFDANENSGVQHNEVYTTYAAANRRYTALANNMSCYSWVSLYEGCVKFGRVRYGRQVASCDSCCGKYNYYHGDGSDF